MALRIDNAVAKLNSFTDNDAYRQIYGDKKHQIHLILLTDRRRIGKFHFVKHIQRDVESFVYQVNETKAINHNDFCLAYFNVTVNELETQIRNRKEGSFPTFLSKKVQKSWFVASFCQPRIFLGRTTALLTTRDRFCYELVPSDPPTISLGDGDENFVLLKIAVSAKFDRSGDLKFNVVYCFGGTETSRYTIDDGTVEYPHLSFEYNCHIQHEEDAALPRTKYLVDPPAGRNLQTAFREAFAAVDNHIIVTAPVERPWKVINKLTMSSGTEAKYEWNFTQLKWVDRR